MDGQDGETPVVEVVEGVQLLDGTLFSGEKDDREGNLIGQGGLYTGGEGVVAAQLSRGFQGFSIALGQKQGGGALGVVLGNDPDLKNSGSGGWVYVPTDFDTKEKALSGAKAAEKGLK